MRTRGHSSLCAPARPQSAARAHAARARPGATRHIHTARNPSRDGRSRAIAHCPRGAAAASREAAAAARQPSRSSRRCDGTRSPRRLARIPTNYSRAVRKPPSFRVTTPFPSQGTRVKSRPQMTNPDSEGFQVRKVLKSLQSVAYPLFTRLLCGFFWFSAQVAGCSNLNSEEPYCTG